MEGRRLRGRDGLRGGRVISTPLSLSSSSVKLSKDFLLQTIMRRHNSQCGALESILHWHQASGNKRASEKKPDVTVVIYIVEVTDQAEGWYHYVAYLTKVPLVS